MPRKRRSKVCGCGCGSVTRGGDFKPGHDTKVYSAIVEEFGGVLNLKKAVEKCTGRPIVVIHD